MIPWAKPSFGTLEKQYVCEALDSTWISGGPFVERLETEFVAAQAPAMDVDGLTCSNGTTALYLALLALGVGPSDEVIVPGFGFAAPANMTRACGARIVAVDIDPRTWCLDTQAVERALTMRTRAIIAVHTYGNVCDVATLRRLVHGTTIAIIEDVAEATFSRRGHRTAGTLGDIGCFSFQATKTITTGEGGFVIAHAYDPRLRRMRCLRDHGMRAGKRYWHDYIGHNFRLTNLQAALGCAQLAQLGTILAKRRRVATLYAARLHDLCNSGAVTTQHFDIDVDPVVWAITVKIDPKAFHLDRDAIIKTMHLDGVETRPGFYPLSAMPIYGVTHSLPFSEDVGAHVISLPSFPDLTDSEIDASCTALERLRR